MTTGTIARARPILAAVGFAGALAGCLSGPNKPLEPYRTTEAPNAIEVSVIHRTLAVHFDPEQTAPRPKDVEALNVLLATHDIAPGDTVRIERAASVIADARARGLASALARQGLKATLAAPGGAPEGELRLVVEHAVAAVPDCPNWTKPPGNDFENTLHSDFGCATAVDLAAMVADPRDLVEGRPMAPVVGDVAIWPMNRYRNGLPENSEATSHQPWDGAATVMATAPTKSQSSPGAGNKAPSGATSSGGGAAAAAVAGAGLPAGGYGAPSGGPQ
jgi:pilus assembly protein CpaD